MAIKTKQLYGLNWKEKAHPVEIELHMIKCGGQWKDEQGNTVGEGLAFHYKRLQQMLWPDKAWHKWNELIVSTVLNNRVTGILGPASCVAGKTRILNPITGEQPTIEDLCKSKTRPMVMTLFGPKLAEVPFVKGTADLFEVKMSSGRSWVATKSHRVLAKDGDFYHVENLRKGQQLAGYEPCLQASTLDTFQSIRGEDAQSSPRTVEDFQSGYPACPCFYDARLHSEEGFFQDVAPLQAGVLERKLCLLVGGSLESTPSHSHLYSAFFPPSMRLIDLPSLSMGRFLSRPLSEETHEPCVLLFQQRDRSLKESIVPSSFLEPALDFDSTLHFLNESVSTSHHPTSSGFFSCGQYTVQPDTVSSIRWIGHDVYYDLNVPDYHHYFAEGSIHHNSGKTCEAAGLALCTYYAHPNECTVICSSTEREMLEMRVWGEIKKYHKEAKERFQWLSGNLIESRQRIVTDNKDECSEGRDFRNGICGVACKRGNSWVGLSSFIGCKNKYVMLIADEGSLMPPAYVDAIANLNKNRNFRCIVMGNPMSTTDALGKICEPDESIGGWESGIDQTGGTKTWKTRFPDGVCIQLVGSDSPNYDGQLGIPLITKKQIDSDAKFYGKDSLQFTMMNEGRMPRGEGSRRVLTRRICKEFNAFDAPIWKGTPRTKIGSLDAAYGGVGGDRCMFAEMEFGTAIVGDMERQIIHLVETTIVPVSVKKLGEAEGQIAEWCKEQCERRGIPPENFFYDAGMKTSLVMSFSRLWTPAVCSVDFGGKPSVRPVDNSLFVLEKGSKRLKRCDEHYSKFVTELWFSVRYAVEANQFRGMTEDAIGEFSMREWIMVMGNKIEVEPKKIMKQRCGYSPDLADCVAVGVEGARQRGFQISRLLNPEAEINDQAWWATMANQARELRQKHELVRV